MKLKTGIFLKSSLAGVLIFSFLFGGIEFASADAYLPERQLIFSDSGALDGAEASAHQGVGLLSAGSITAISYYLSWNGTGSAPSVAARLYCSSSNVYGSADCGQTDTVTQVVSGTSATLYTFSFASPISINTSKYYAIGLNFTGSGGAQLRYHGSVENAWRGTTTETKCFIAGICGTLSDIYFRISATAGNSIAFVYPVSGSTNLQNFGLWKLDYSLATSTNSAYINIFVNSTSTVSQTSYMVYDQEPVSTFAGYHGATLNRLHFSDYASGTTYYAKAYLMGTSGSVLASSAVINFSIDDVGAELYFPVVDTPFLNQSTEEASEAENFLRQKFPFAYFYELSDLYSTAVSTSTNALPLLAFSVPFPVGSSTSITVLSSSTLRNTMGSDNFDALYLLEGYAIYGMTAYYFINRIRNLRLHMV